MPKPFITPIKSENILLRLLEQSDLALTLAWRNQDKIRKWFINSEVINQEQHQNWYARYRECDNDLLFIIEETRTLHKPIGQISLYHLDWETGKGECGRLLIGEKAALHRGFAKQATKLLLDYAFGQLRMKEIELIVVSENIVAISLYKSCGFKEVEEIKGLKKMVIQDT